MDWTVAFSLYLFTRLDAIQALFISLAIAFTAIACVYGVIATIESELEGHRRAVLTIALALVSAFLAAATPSQKDMALIVGGAIGYEQASNLVSNERFRNLSNNSLKALERWVEEQAEAE